PLGTGTVVRWRRPEARDHPAGGTRPPQGTRVALIAVAHTARTTASCDAVRAHAPSLSAHVLRTRPSAASSGRRAARAYPRASARRRILPRAALLPANAV